MPAVMIQNICKILGQNNKNMMIQKLLNSLEESLLGSITEKNHHSPRRLRWQEGNEGQGQLRPSLWLVLAAVPKRTAWHMLLPSKDYSKHLLTYCMPPFFSVWMKGLVQQKVLKGFARFQLGKYKGMKASRENEKGKYCGGRKWENLFTCVQDLNQFTGYVGKKKKLSL